MRPFTKRRSPLALLCSAFILTFVFWQATPVQPQTGDITPIYTIQAETHTSPFEGQNVTTEGQVTALADNGFYIQDVNGDGNDNTSDGIFVFTDSNPTVSVDDLLQVTGTVQEFTFSGLTTTQIGDAGLSIDVLSSGNTPLTPVVIGNDGRIPPNSIIDNDSLATFDPEQDGIDFFESIEGMLVQVNDARVVGPRRFGEITVLGDNGTNANQLTARGGIHISPTDFNPERIITDDALVSEPAVTVGDVFDAPIIGVISYSFENYKLFPLSYPSVTPGSITRETTTLVGDDDTLTVSAYNILNFPTDSDADNIAADIVTNMQAPDIISLQEVQDDSAEDDDGTVSAANNYADLIAAIQNAGGPTYDFREIAPIDVQDGGVPGGNIRVGFLFNPARVTFVDRAGGDATTATGIVNNDGVPELEFSPGRIDPTSFVDSRKPLVGEFVFNGQTVFIIAAHFNSKSGDDALFGDVQPPVHNSEVERQVQADAVASFISNLLAVDANANVIVAGDLNDFEFRNPLQTIEDAGMSNLYDGLDVSERYSYIFNGNSQALDHIMVSANLMTHLVGFEPVHINSEFDFMDRTSDHDPLVAAFNFAIEVPSSPVDDESGDPGTG